MKKINLGQTVSIIANLGVVAGLVFVGLQIQQERQIAQANRLQSNSGAYRDWAEIVANNADLWARGIADEPLSPAEEIAFDELARAREGSMYAAWQSAVLTGQSGELVNSLLRETALEFSSHPGLIRFWREHEQRMRTIGRPLDYQEQVNVEIARLLSSGVSGQTEEAVRSYFEGMNSGDISDVPFAEDVYFWGPLVPGGLNGRAEVSDFLGRVANGENSWSEDVLIVDGNSACSMTRFKPAGWNGSEIRMSDCFEVLDGQITRLELFFDPRPLVRD